MRLSGAVNGIAGKFGLEIRRRYIPRNPRFSVQTPLRSVYLFSLLGRIGDVEGELVECGVGRGVSILIWCAFLEYSKHHQGEHKWPERHIWGFDSFEGLPEPSIEDFNTKRTNTANIRAGTVGDTSRLGVVAMLKRASISPEFMADHLSLVPGWFEDTLPNFDAKIALLHIDVDLHDSYKHVLSELYDQVVPGGVIAFDEYKSESALHRFPGASTAIDAFFEDKPGKIEEDRFFGNWFYVKPAR